ncbi:hypothetical protein ACLB2K_036550 [Fragaria x ananassa]
MRPNCLLLLLLAPLLAFGDHSRMFSRRVIDDAEEEELLAGMGPQRVNINDAHLKEIAEFAVSEFNKESLKSFVFQKVVSGISQLVAGSSYTLVIANSDMDVHPLGTIVLNCRAMMQHFDFVQIKHIHRERNMVADLLAKNSTLNAKGICIFNEPPDLVTNALLDDIVGVTRCRTVNTSSAEYRNLGFRFRVEGQRRSRLLPACGDQAASRCCVAEGDQSHSCFGLVAVGFVRIQFGFSSWSSSVIAGSTAAVVLLRWRSVAWWLQAATQREANN